MSKMRLWFVGFLIWMAPAVTFALVGKAVHDDGAWWLWVIAFAVSIGFHACLDWYVAESYRAAIRDELEG